jgi:hypothetical protein
MSSPGNAMATSGGGAGNAQWQIDIPSLSQLIVNLGASGLKQLAMAGVDVHSVGCLLLIANLTPTTIEYRQELNRIRESQRKDRIWLYKVVEIGAATNFLADQLLKTRAGENVLALLSALLPLLPEREFVAVLLKSFECCSIPAASTPGIGQISRIREALNPFMARTVVKDRILQYHSLFSTTTSTTTDLSKAIPPPNVIPEVLSVFHKLATHDDPFVLHYHGIQGAAWAATYACNVLGLQAIAILSNGDVISLNSTYDQAQVLFYIDSKKNELLIRQRGDIESLISMSSQDGVKLSEMPWLINCDSVNWLKYIYPEVQTSGLWDDISNYVAEAAFSLLSHVVSSGFVKPPNQNLVTYGEYHFDDILNRLLNILTILGFKTETREFLVQRHENSGGVGLQANEIISKLPRSLQDGIRQIINLSVLLAFTNWDTNIRALSAELFNIGQVDDFPYIRISEFTEDLLNNALFLENSILNEVIAWCTASSPRAKLERDKFDTQCLARDFDGTVVLLNSICEQSLVELKGYLWKLYPGQIIGDGEKCIYIKEELESVQESIRFIRQSAGTVAGPGLVEPRNKLLSIAFLQDIMISGNTIFTESHALVNEHALLPISVKDICRNLNRIFISKGCSHSLDQLPFTSYHPTDHPWIMNHSYYLNLPSCIWTQEPEGYCIAQQVDGNTLGQWLSSSFISEPNPLDLIWQRYSCLECIAGKTYRNPWRPFAIIADTAPRPT